jgi:hypothetical protein
MWYIYSSPDKITPIPPHLPHLLPPPLSTLPCPTPISHLSSLISHLSQKKKIKKFKKVLDFLKKMLYNIDSKTDASN